MRGAFSGVFFCRGRREREVEGERKQEREIGIASAEVGGRESKREIERDREKGIEGDREREGGREGGRGRGRQGEMRLERERET